jgi:protein KRI1
METAFDEDYYAQGEKHRPDISTAEDIEDVEEWLKKVKANAKKSGSSAGADAAEIEKALEDYYNLDFDEVIGEDRVRFRYTEVPKQDYGLTNEELLNMSDSELDAVIPMKKLSAYREDGGKMKKHRVAFKRREWAARRMEELGLSKKKKSHKSSPGDAPEAAFSESTKQKKRRRESFDGSEGADSKPATKKQKTKE